MALNDLLHMSGSGLRAYQSQISVHSNNIANVGTSGYSRRTVGLESAVSSNGSGSGVKTGDVTRLYNALGTSQLLKEESGAAYHSNLAQALSDVESLVGSGSGELDAAMRNFRNALQDAITSPDDIAARTTLLQRSSTLAAEMSKVDETLSSVETMWDSPSGVVDDINELTEQLQTLNRDITKAENGGRSAPGLLDDRDRLVRNLSELTNFTITPDYRVTVGGEELVSADGINRQELVVDASNAFSVGGVDVSASVTGGKVSAMVVARDMAQTMQEQVNTMASAFITEMNGIFDGAYNLNGESPADLGYTFFTGSSASDIAVDTAMYDPLNPMAANPNMLALAETRASAGPPAIANPGDNAAGQALVNAFEAPNATLGNTSYSDFWLKIETSLGATVQEENRQAISSESVVEMLDARMSSVSGVNLDEELMGMMSAQKAYEACARVMSTASNMLDTLINLGR